jgi:hypothetical protein
MDVRSAVLPLTVIVATGWPTAVAAQETRQAAPVTGVLAGAVVDAASGSAIRATLRGGPLTLSAYLSTDRTSLSIRFTDPAVPDKPIDAFGAMSAGSFVLTYNRGAERITYHRR